ncbi:MAG: hypothetical protein FJ397_12010 [Verrucomicrobia bacterium]|nr:hypothetical protein [Verrucomicrobiota bacterium]
MAIPNFATPSDWSSHEFYRRSLVLGIDIGLSYIGIYLRLGDQPLVGETVVYSSRDSLVQRRQLRHLRRNRRSLRQRVFRLRQWCARFGLPWAPRADWQPAMERAFLLRHRGEAEPGSLSPGELVVCLRHILGLRGYDWHRSGESEGTYPWGEKEPLSRECLEWLGREHITAASAQTVRALLPPDLSEEDAARMESLLTAAIERSDRDGMMTHLRAHAASPLTHRGRDRNFPREVLEEHAANLIRNHAAHFGATGTDTPLQSYLEILNYHRKDAAAQERHWESKAGECPFNGGPRAPASDPDARRFKLLEFLATRRVAVMPRARSSAMSTLRTPSAAVVAWLLRLPADTAEPLPASRDFRGEFERRVCGADEKLAPDAKSLNGDYFSQLRDLIYPRGAGKSERAALSASAARLWFDLATRGGKTFEPAEIVRSLRERPDPASKSFYEKRREAQLSEWFHPHVEFLLGPRAYLLDGKSVPAGQVHGWINRMLARPSVASRLAAAGHGPRPDYVVIEVAGDMPRTAEGRMRIEQDQKERRQRRDDRVERYGLAKASEAQLLRLELWEQQGGTDRLPARCPMTGAELSGGPLSNDLEVAHIYPATWGGPYLRDNLFLTTREVNAAMLNQPPAQCRGFSPTHLAGMRWSERKRALFVTPWQRPPLGELPDWGFDTRVAQLARQLRDAMRVWLGLRDENEVARRVGTVSGYFTAQCRKAWLEDYRKDRSDLRNHLYDAMVLAHIPPGSGLNTVALGGIFETVLLKQQGGGLAPAYRPLRALGPDWRAFDAAHKDSCLVQYPRSSAPKKARFDTTVYGVEASPRTLPDGTSERAPRLRVREVITSGGWPVKDAEKWFAECSARSPAFAAAFPERKWRAWIEENTRRNKEKREPLPLDNPGGGTVRAVSVDASKPSFFAPDAVALHDPAGVKNPIEKNLAVELFETTRASGLKQIKSRIISHPRFALLRRTWEKKGIATSPDDPLPPGLKPLARLKKGDLLRVPLLRDGEIAESDGESYVKLWVRVTSIKSNGTVEAKPCEYLLEQMELDAGGSVNREGARLFGARIKKVYPFQNASLLHVIRCTPAAPA